jgi:trans-aconitate methyltransferase
MADWDPDLYHKFRNYRDEPFRAILARLEAEGAEQQTAGSVANRIAERIVDLGCGTGENTARRSGSTRRPR